MALLSLTVLAVRALTAAVGCVSQIARLGSRSTVENSAGAIAVAGEVRSASTQFRSVYGRSSARIRKKEPSRADSSRNYENGRYWRSKGAQTGVNYICSVMAPQCLN
jgi:hypothetical protein